MLYIGLTAKETIYKFISAVSSRSNMYCKFAWLGIRPTMANQTKYIDLMNSRAINRAPPSSEEARKCCRPREVATAQ